MARQNARTLYGNTNRSSCVPDACEGACVPDAHAAGARVPDACGAGACVPDARGAAERAHGARDADARALDSCASTALNVNPHRAGQRIAGQYLADALIVWDCYADAPLARTPVLLRFESFDLVCRSASEGGLALACGAVDTAHAPAGALFDEYPEVAFAEAASANGRSDAHTGAVPADASCADADAPACPAWVPAPALARLVGLQAEGVAQEGGALRIRFDECTLVLGQAHGSIACRIEEG